MYNNNGIKRIDAIESKPSAGPEINYSPKPHTLQEQIIFGVKLFLISGIILLILWLLEKYSAE